MINQRPAPRFLQQVTLQNFLSFGPEPTELQCRALNVFIGPNASGKSNFLEALGLLASCPRNLQDAIRYGGGVSEWLWKGGESASVASIEAVVDSRTSTGPLRYRLQFTEAHQRLEVVTERLEQARPSPGQTKPTTFYLYEQGRGELRMHLTGPARTSRAARAHRTVAVEDLEPSRSILSERRDPSAYPELTFLADSLGQVRLYRDLNLGRFSPLRAPQKTDLPEDFLLEDGSNLALVLNELHHHPQAGQTVTAYLRKFYETAGNYAVRVIGGTVQLVIHEKGQGNPVIPATRLSDGTLRYLCLLAVLCHPTPPPVVCIEEPEIGLHPDMIATIAELLRGASKRTQLFITTHSDALVDALTDSADAVVVCERGDNGTQFKRLEPDKLKAWLKRYSLGELWMKGEIGGARW
jgi:predicted ATPase